MEHLENDMDDLFQKAGELYPLKITGSDWDAVAGKLQNEDPGDMRELTGVTGISSRRRKWLLLLLLIPLGLGTYYFSGNLKQGPQNAISTKAPGGSSNQNKINSVIPDNRESPPSTADKRQVDNKKTPVSDNHPLEAGKKNNAGNSGMKGTGSAKTRKLSYAAAGGKQVPVKNSLKPLNQISSSNDRTKSDLNSNNLHQGSKETTGDAVNN